ncbi:hypothetical protein [Umezawaea beigongshangensis]|uniref:hypothetical protein n=1 Tax=Umezawaea beigongshangensis TaxID=2780383 RepID=UPI0018F20AAD|nr:hypothetical protein [Umezawaea beigongshangensis]
MERRALITAEPRSGRARRRWPAVLAASAAVLGCAFVTARVAATDPVGYGLAFWPIASAADEAEDRLMAAVESTARTAAGLAEVPEALGVTGEVEVLSADVRDAGSTDGSVLMRIRFRVQGDGQRCREVMVRGNAEVSSRRVDC